MGTATRHYVLQVLSRPVQGTPGRVTVTVTLPAPQLPRSVHDVTIDNTLSHPMDTQHSWTYPGFGCGALIQPQFAAVGAVLPGAESRVPAGHT